MQLRPVLLALALASCKAAAAPPAATPVTPPTHAPTHAPTPAPKPSPTGERGQLEGLTAAHNQHRAKVGVRPLRWSNALARWAGAWAQELATHGCQLAHRPAGADQYGENIFWSSGPSTSEAVVAQWAAEQTGYDHRHNTCAGTCGHWTQLVWKRTTKLGCGMAACPGGAEIWVCNYDPAGNVMGQSPY